MKVQNIIRTLVIASTVVVAQMAQAQLTGAPNSVTLKCQVGGIANSFRVTLKNCSIQTVTGPEKPFGSLNDLLNGKVELCVTDQGTRPTGINGAIQAVPAKPMIDYLRMVRSQQAILSMEIPFYYRSSVNNAQPEVYWIVREVNSTAGHFSGTMPYIKLGSPN